MDADGLASLLESEYRRLNATVYTDVLPPFPGVRLTNGVRRLGSCRARVTRHGATVTGFTLSRRLLDTSEEVRLDTVRHEVAHAAAILLDGDHAHGPAWRRHAVRCGATPRACTEPGAVPELPRDAFPIVVACTSCPHWRGYLRKGRVATRPSAYRCGRCGGRLKVE